MRVGAISSREPVDPRSLVSGWQIPLEVSDKLAAALAAMGRTEDLAVSPDGKLLAVACFDSNRIALIGFEVIEDSVRITRIDSAAVDGLDRPHGVVFLDDVTLLVANRESDVLLVTLDPKRWSACDSRILVGASTFVPAQTPGSVAVRRLGGGLVELLVCNNSVHNVTTYLLDKWDGFRVVDGEKLLAAHLDIPDGVALSNDGLWIAVSNHNHHAVNIYRYDEVLDSGAAPCGLLRGVNYPHGLEFSSDDRKLVVADAGLPNVCIYEAPGGDWSGEHLPRLIGRVMNEYDFHRGRHNPQEGGPKGLAFVDKDIFVVTSEFRPLSFFKVSKVMSAPVGELRRAGGDKEGLPFRIPFLRMAARLVSMRAAEDVALQKLAALEQSCVELEAQLEAERSERQQLRLSQKAAELVIEKLRRWFRLSWRRLRDLVCSIGAFDLD